MLRYLSHYLYGDVMYYNTNHRVITMKLNQKLQEADLFQHFHACHTFREEFVMSWMREDVVNVVSKCRIHPNMLIKIYYLDYEKKYAIYGSYDKNGTEPLFTKGCDDVDSAVNYVFNKLQALADIHLATE